MEVNLNTLWTVLASILVFFMQAGFAAVEIGLSRDKNAINIYMKNLADFVLGSLTFYLIGFGLMFGVSNGFFGTTDFLLSGVSGEHWNYTFIFFQTVFAATAATIVSGAMAERTKFSSYLLISVAITTFIYPIFGSWAWGSLLKGGGWLEKLPTGAFCDFAGSTVVHSIGGWISLVGAWMVGPRLGKFDLRNKPRAIPGHNMILAGIGVFILWMGWFGFNAGSTMAANLSIGRLAFITNLGGVSGAMGAMFFTWILFKKPDASMTMNGALGGLVSVTAGCATFTPNGAIIVGLLGGIFVVLSVMAIEKVLKIDDPVGAISVHGLCGVWGTFACGLFNAQAVLGIGEKSTGLFYGGGWNQLISQMIGIGACALWACGTGFIVFTLIKRTVGLRVEEREEYAGLDIEEHGMEAYYISK
jgi:Amt family ammonium transporter